MRVVLDTNVLVSALLKTGGSEAIAVEMVLTGALQGFVSEPILTEYREVLGRPKFRFTPYLVHSLMRRLGDATVVVTPQGKADVSPHEADNRFIECAQAANAHFLVTGNLRHFPAQFGVTRVLTCRELLDVLQSKEHP